MTNEQDILQAEKKQKGSACKRIGAVAAVMAGIAFLFQIVFAILNGCARVRYLYEWLFYGINGIFLIGGVAAVWIFFWKRWTELLTASLIFLVLMGINLYAAFSTPSTGLLSVSPDGGHAVLIRADAENNKTTIYKRKLLFWAVPMDVLDENIGQPLNPQWVVSDVCSVSYLDEEGELCCYVAALGKRDSEADFPDLIGQLKGHWMLSKGDVGALALDVDTGEIDLSTYEGKENYLAREAVVVKDAAMVLFSQGEPKWVVALDENCKINETNDIAKGGTIGVLPVTLENIPAAAFVRTSDTPEPGEDPFQSQEGPGEDTPFTEEASGTDERTKKGWQIAKELEEMLQAYPDLSNLYDYQMKVTTDSSDPFEVGLLLYQQNLEKIYKDENDFDVQITELELTAGDSSEFLLMVTCDLWLAETGNVWTSVDTFRLRKGDGVYLGLRVYSDTDGTVGLAVQNPPPVKQIGEDETYHFEVRYNWEER